MAAPSSPIKIQSTTLESFAQAPSEAKIEQSEYSIPASLFSETRIEKNERFALASSFSFKISPLYSDLLLVMNVNPSLYSLSFRSKARVFECRNPNCDVDLVVIPIIDCGRYHPYASYRHAQRVAKRFLAQLDFLHKRGADYLISIDLTISKEVSESLPLKEMEPRLRKAVNSFLKKLHRSLFSNHDSQFGGIFHIHPWATRDPTKRHLHAHVHLVNLTRDRNGKFHRFRPWLDEGLVKKLWKEVLRQEGLLTFDLVLLDSALPDVKIHYIKLEQKGRVQHRIRYASRKPITDLNENLTRESLENLDREWIRFLLDYTPRATCFGFFTNLKASGFRHSSRSKRVERCPRCGNELVFLRYLDEIPDSLPWKIVNREGELVDIEPPPPP